jgi:hypothetical protein
VDLPARPDRLKEHALTGRPLSGRQAADVEPVNHAYENMGIASTQVLGPTSTA